MKLLVEAVSVMMQNLQKLAPKGPDSAAIRLENLCCCAMKNWVSKVPIIRSFTVKTLVSDMFRNCANQLSTDTTCSS